MLSRASIARGVFAFVYAAVAPARAQVSSNFNAGLDGWTADGDGVITYSAAFGNPAGSARITDLGTGDYFYFDAPASYLGDQSASLGGSLSFDLWTAVSSASADPALPDVLLQGAGLTLVLDLPLPPAAAWRSYTVTLDPTADWRVGIGGSTRPTPSEFRAVLADLVALRIRGEFSTSNDVTYLDNVSLTAAPCPADLNGDGIADFGDVSAFVNAFSTQDALADRNNDGVIDFGDVSQFLTDFTAGC
jgi:hypothetical protein